MACIKANLVLAVVELHKFQIGGCLAWYLLGLNLNFDFDIFCLEVVEVETLLLANAQLAKSKVDFNKCIT